MVIGPLSEEFLTHLRVERRLSPNTVRAYAHDIRTFLGFLAHNGTEATIDNVTPQLLRQYLAFLNGKGLGPATVRRRFHGLRSFWSYLCDWHDVACNPFRRITLPKASSRPPLFLSQEEVQRLLEAAEDTRFVVRGIRDRAVLTLLVCTGLRRQELLDLALPDLDLEEGLLRVRNGKGGRGRVVPLLSEAVDAVRDWLELRPRCGHSILFTNHIRAPLGVRGLHDLFH